MEETKKTVGTFVLAAVVLAAAALGIAVGGLVAWWAGLCAFLATVAALFAVAATRTIRRAKRKSEDTPQG